MRGGGVVKLCGGWGGVVEVTYCECHEDSQFVSGDSYAQHSAHYQQSQCHVSGQRLVDWCEQKTIKALCVCACTCAMGSSCLATETLMSEYLRRVVVATCRVGQWI